MNLNIIVSGQSIKLKINKKTLIKNLIENAKIKTGNTGNLEWEARTSEGKLLDNNTTIENNKLIEGQQVYINPRAGFGG